MTIHQSDVDLMDEWVDALRSGKYDQGHGQLREQNSFCCLGVLCDIYSEDGWNEVGEYTFPESKPGKPGFYPTSHSALEGELKDIAIKFIPQSECIEMNDEEDRDFQYIAQEVECQVNKRRDEVDNG